VPANITTKQSIISTQEIIFLIHLLKTNVMAKKNAPKANGGIPGVTWFFRSLPYLEQNKGLSVAQRKTNAEKETKKLFKESENVKKWKIVNFDWTNPPKKDEKFMLRVIIRRKRGHTGPPNSDPPIRAERQPPPSM
jgi:hypothetical protein